MQNCRKHAQRAFTENDRRVLRVPIQIWNSFEILRCHFFVNRNCSPLFKIFDTNVYSTQNATMSITIKIFGCDGTDSVRRRKFDTTSVTLTQVQELANLPSHAKLTWKDEDGDVITIVTHADLKEAVSSAVTQNSPLRLYVDHSKLPQAQTKAEPTCGQRSRDIHQRIESVSQGARHKMFSAFSLVRSACESSRVFRALKEDSRSVRAVLEARVERNLSDAPIQAIASYFIYAVLLWALFCPSFFLLFKIAIAAVFVPRNALSEKAHKRIRLLIALIAVRLALKLIYYVLPSCLFFGMAFCFVPKFLLGLTIFGWLCKKGRNHRSCSAHHSNRRAEHRDQFRASQQQNLTSWQREDVVTISKIFPALNYEHLRKTYMIHKDVQATVLALLKQTEGAR